MKRRKAFSWEYGTVRWALVKRFIFYTIGVSLLLITGCVHRGMRDKVPPVPAPAVPVIEGTPHVHCLRNNLDGIMYCTTDPEYPNPNELHAQTTPCYSTTMDGLPNCPMPKMTAAECLDTFPPHQVGGFCEWYGYATLQEIEKFEKKAGFKRATPRDLNSIELWKKK